MSPVVILLVEDNAEDVHFLQQALAKAGLRWNIRVAPDGQQAIDALSAASTLKGASGDPAPSHVLLDLKLPRKSGLEVLAWIRGHAALASTPVIVLTSSNMPSEVQLARSLGVDEYLVKPLTLKGLVEVLRTIAARWGLPLP